MRKGMRRAMVGFGFCLAICQTTAAWAGTVMSYGGRLAGSDDKGVEGPVDLEVTFFGAASGGSPLAEAMLYRGVPLDDGVFQLSMDMGFGAWHAIFPKSSQDVWIQIRDVTHGVTYPRQRYATVPFALKIPVDGSAFAYNASGELSLKGGGTVDPATVITSINGASSGTINAERLPGLGGDVTGSVASATVAKIQGKPVSSASPTVSQVLTWDGVQWAPASPGGGGGEPAIAAGTTSQYWRGDKTWQTLDLGSIPGIVPIARGGTGMASGPANQVFATPIGSTGAPSFRSLSPVDLPVMVGSNGTTAGNQGAVPAPASNDYTKFLRGDGTWQSVTGGNPAYGSSASPPTNSAYVDDFGNLGVGTMSPGNKLTVQGVNSQLGVWDSSASSYVMFDAQSSWSRIMMKNGSGFQTVIKTDSGGTHFSNGVSPTEKMIIDSNGNVGIGTTAPTNALDVVGDINTASCLKLNGTNLSGGCASDARFKKDVRPLTGSLEKLSLLRPVTYHYLVDEFPERHFSRNLETGLIAQELKEVFPELVVTDPDGYMRVHYGLALQMHVIAAVKELKAKDDALQGEVAAIKAENAALKAENRAIMGLLCEKFPEADLCRP